MNRKIKYSLMVLCMVSTLFSQVVFASEDKIKSEGQPIASYWYPEQLLQWDVNKDVDANYNKSSIPLTQRVEKENLNTINKNQDKNAKLMAISIMNANTSGNPSQGSSKFETNTFSYWQYVDTLVYWGGSAGEGIIVPPSADVIDAAHKNGVKVIGTVFFPPTTYGGKIEWFNTFLKKDINGDFVMVDKLIEVCETYGFEGWFINQETENANQKQAKDMQDFIKTFKSKAPHLDIVWYDSMISNGSIQWQNALTDKNKMFLIDEKGNAVSDDMFLNFWWGSMYRNTLKTSKIKADSLGIDAYDLYAGIDVQANGYNTKADWKDWKASKVSLGLYCPSWTYFSADSREDYFARENRFWVNEAGNPKKSYESDGSKWNGISNYMVEKTNLVSVPFITNFSVGNGHKYFAQGLQIGEKDWNNRSLQNVLPTYRWIIESEGDIKLVPSIDYTAAYEAGNSLKLEGTVSANKPVEWMLYSSNLKVEKDNFAELAIKTSSDNLDIELLLALKNGAKISIPAQKNIKNGWTLLSYNLDNIQGETIEKIGIKLITSENKINLNIGQLRIDNSNINQAMKIENIYLDEVNIEDSLYAGVRMHWEADSNAELYEIYEINDKNKTLVGATPNNYYYVDKIKRVGSSSSAVLQVVPVDMRNNRGDGNTKAFEWPEYPKPKSDFKQNKTLIAPGEEVEFTSKCSEVTEEIEWIFEGGSPNTSSKENQTVTYAQEGVYTVKLIAKNQSGESEIIKEGLVTVSNQAIPGLTNLSLNKAVQATSFVNPAEAPKYAVDGKTNTKWCAVGDGPHQITIDLGVEKMISEIRIHHAEAGGESASMSTRGYTLETSNDNKTFTQVVQVDDNTAGMSSDAFKVVKARYVRLTVNQATQGADKAARIYEIEVMGLK